MPFSRLIFDRWLEGEFLWSLLAGFSPHFVVIRPLQADYERDYSVASSFGSLTRLYAVAVSVNIQPTRSFPRWRVLRKPPLVLAQPPV